MKFFGLVFLLILALSNGNFVQEFEKLKFIRENDSSSGKIWVLLIAGSSGYDNYRHQVSCFMHCQSSVCLLYRYSSTSNCNYVHRFLKKAAWLLVQGRKNSRLTVSAAKKFQAAQSIVVIS